MLTSPGGHVGAVSPRNNSLFSNGKKGPRNNHSPTGSRHSSSMCGGPHTHDGHRNSSSNGSNVHGLRAHTASAAGRRHGSMSHSPRGSTADAATSQRGSLYDVPAYRLSDPSQHTVQRPGTSSASSHQPSLESAFSPIPPSKPRISTANAAMPKVNASAMDEFPLSHNAGVARAQTANSRGRSYSNKTVRKF